MILRKGWLPGILDATRFILCSFFFFLNFYSKGVKREGEGQTHRREWRPLELGIFLGDL
jgi:hypothetical protein